MDPFLGEIRLFGGTFAPTGYAACNGALIPISQNDALYSLYGTTYGGDGVSTFGLPDLQGRVPIHDGTGNGLSPYVPGQKGGAESVTLLDVHHPAHNHAFSASQDTATTTTLAGNLIGTLETGNNLYYQGVPNVALGPHAIQPITTGGQPHENRMPSLAITYIVAIAGVFPSHP